MSKNNEERVGGNFIVVAESESEDLWLTAFLFVQSLISNVLSKKRKQKINRSYSTSNTFASTEYGGGIFCYEVKYIYTQKNDLPSKYIFLFV